MIYGIGTDLCAISRMEKVYQRFGEKVVKRFLADVEIAANKKPITSAWLAKRFAAKEAISKAMGTGFANGLTLKDIHILNTEEGKPFAAFSERGKKNLPPNSRVFLSLSDEKGYALAFAVIEQNDKTHKGA